MKPLNLDNRPCSPISSNCVIWQGPDIPCIKLCAGDTISDVVAKLATELCTIMDTLDIKNYDLSCFNLAACPPDTFQELIQFLIEQICASQGLDTTKVATPSTCPDCVVSVASCFVVGIQTTMQLVDYVNMIGQRICNIIDEITNINSEIDIINNTLENLQIQIDNIPTYTLPSIPADCILAAGNYPLDQILNALMNDDTLGYCSLLTATGTPAQITNGVLSQCIADGDPSLASLAAGDSPVQSFSTYYLGTWVNNPSLTLAPTVANAIRNLWIAICDTYTYLSNITSSITVVDAGEGITVTSATVGSTTTYTVINDYLEVFTANVTINDDFVPASGIIPKVVPSSVSGVEDGQVIFRYTSVLSNDQLVVAGTGAFVPNADLPPITFGSFNNTTGLFTITDPGTYLIKATIHLKPDNGSTVFWSGETTYSTPPTVEELRDNFNAIGSFYIGIHPNNATDTFVASSQTMTPSIDKNVEISTSKVITATNPTTLRLKVLNTTNRDYNGTTYSGSDGISFSIIKLRSGLTITNL